MRRSRNRRGATAARSGENCDKLEHRAADRLSAIEQIKREWEAQARSPSAQEVDAWILLRDVDAALRQIEQGEGVPHQEAKRQALARFPG